MSSFYRLVMSDDETIDVQKSDRLNGLYQGLPRTPASFVCVITVDGTRLGVNIDHIVLIEEIEVSNGD